MKQKQDVILRYFRDGDSMRKISRDLGLNRKTVCRYVKDYSSKLDTKSGDVNKSSIVLNNDLCASPEYKLSPRPKRKVSKSLINEVQQHLDENYKKRQTGRHKQQLKKIDIFELVKDQGFAVGYTTICNLIRDLENKSSETFIRQSYSPGEVCEFDWGEVKINVGQGIEKYQLAVFTSAYSNYRFAYLFKHQDTISFQQSHVHFFSHTGGVFKELVYDNMRVAVKKFVGPTEKEATDGLLKLSMYYHFNYRFCNVRKGNEKGHVERSVEYIRRKAFAFEDEFSNLEEANQYLQQVCNRLNNIAQKEKNNKTAKTLFNDEKSLLLVPKQPFICSEEYCFKADTWSTIRFRSCHYSVPEHLNGKMVTIKVFTEEIACIYEDSTVCVHKRLYGLNQWSIQIEHYTQTLKQKPGALLGSVAFQQLDGQLKSIYHQFFSQRPKEFVELIEYLKTSKHNISDIEGAIAKLKPFREDDVSLDRIKIICDFNEQSQPNYDFNNEIDEKCNSQLSYISQVLLDITAGIFCEQEVLV